MVANPAKLVLPGPRNGTHSHSAVQEPSSSTGGNKTGFPEPLSPDRNTTLRHPSADTSPGACIESSDVPLSRTHSRVSSRHSFGFGHHRQKSYRYNAPIDMGSVNTAVAGAGGRTSVESIDEVMDGGSATTGKSSVEGGMAADTMNAVPNGVEKGWQGNQEGVGRDSSSLDLEKTRIQTDEQGYKTGQRKKGVLRKLHLHKV